MIILKYNEVVYSEQSIFLELKYITDNSELGKQRKCLFNFNSLILFCCAVGFTAVANSLFQVV